MPFYYPNWINDFWRIMGLIHFGDKLHFCVPGEKRFDEALIRSFCADAGLAFYDTACEVRRLKGNASDAFLEVVTPTDIPALLARIPACHTLVTTGEKASQLAAEAFGCPIPPVGGFVDIVMPETPDQVGGDGKTVGSAVMPGCDRASLRFWRMPSTSRAYPLPLEKKAEAYRQLFP
jgi:G:T/U-mismatch repair DNA glycosylase